MIVSILQILLWLQNLPFFQQLCVGSCVYLFVYFVSFNSYNNLERLFISILMLHERYAKSCIPCWNHSLRDLTQIIVLNLAYGTQYIANPNFYLETKTRALYLWGTSETSVKIILNGDAFILPHSYWIKILVDGFDAGDWCITGNENLILNRLSTGLSSRCLPETLTWTKLLLCSLKSPLLVLLILFRYHHPHKERLLGVIVQSFCSLTLLSVLAPNPADFTPEMSGHPIISIICHLLTSFRTFSLSIFQLHPTSYWPPFF